ncbi:uncharacterized protein Z518_06390 [Rhinocladiella mackenziei CBS 650.93]|uniref:Uncharacterized protein n=1 Tax=Rhinocladiella mackenziei CBS 650.93 TaxID=1442369 RepID=A0A0D2H556_9EURO|nr:uncharacterized protein Z518_06390 [Rhinocladiella mackenziei CBS 650.93]KIX05518.1 hypothetical protein Z518_06390 [Rhinocladiella mackenziei CBS 650.93]
MALMNTIPAVTLTAPARFPTAGVGGSYYDVNFGVPTYGATAWNQISWRLLDNWDRISINYASSEGIAAGLIWATLIYLLALTPNHKRTTSFHSILLVGLVFILIHLMIDIISSLTPGLHTISAYTFLTGDVLSSTWPTNYYGTYATSVVAAWLAFVFAAICLWLQAKGLMTGIRSRFPAAYKVILSYLVLASLAALALGMTFNIQQILNIGKPMTPPHTTQSVQFRNAYLIGYATSIGSYSLVSICSIIDIVWRRPSSVIKGRNAYASALNLVGLLCAQSFVIPFIFCILQIMPSRVGWIQPEIMLLPSVYLNLPLGSLFMTVNSNSSDNRNARFPPKPSPRPVVVCRDQSSTLTDPMRTLFDDQRRKSIWDQFDRELNMIDSLDGSASGTKESDSMLKSKEDNVENTGKKNNTRPAAAAKPTKIRRDAFRVARNQTRKDTVVPVSPDHMV